MRRELGDFQTPPELVAAILDLLDPIGTRWPRVLEPTCGQGHFISGMLARPNPPREIIGIDIQPAYCKQTQAAAMAREPGPGTALNIMCADVFSIDLMRDLKWQADGPLLVIGNPPWITAAALGSIGNSSGPPRHNLKRLRGLDARTGASNFDVAEALWLKLMTELAGEAATIALLSKLAVARGVLQLIERAKLPVHAASIHRIDARRFFGAAVEACLFQATLKSDSRCRRIPVFAALADRKPATYLGFSRGWLIADHGARDRSALVEGVCPLSWRQGIKHDAAAVMELMVDAATGELKTAAGEVVDLEPSHIYPLMKSGDFKLPRPARPGRAVIVTQGRIGEDTTALRTTAPRLWRYLQSHVDRFDRRKSSIYRGQPPFALFGIGPYSFADYKVAISALDKSPRFHAVGPDRGRAVMFDDTCYFLPCSAAIDAAILAALCNDPITLDWIRSASFIDSKRVITKSLLQRIDLGAVLAGTDRNSLLARATAILRDDLAADCPSDLGARANELAHLFATTSRGPVHGAPHPAI